MNEPQTENIFIIVRMMIFYVPSDLAVYPHAPNFNKESRVLIQGG